MFNKECEEELKKFYGIAPYNTPTNIVQKDIYFLFDIIQKYGEEAVKQTEKTLKDNNLLWKNF